MPTYSQAELPMRVETPLGEDVLLLQAFRGIEGISMPFLFAIDLLSDDRRIEADQLLRKAVTLNVEMPDKSTQIYNGIVRSFVHRGEREPFAAYRAEVVPRFWLLSLARDCRIFQEKSVLDIVKEVFKAHGLSDYAIRCTGSYPKRDYCVQYRETDLDFVSRLLEEEGIFYFFEHEGGKHTMVLADANSAMKACPGQSKVRMSPEPGPWQEDDVVLGLEVAHSVHVGKISLTDYDPLKPTSSLLVNEKGEGPEEVYDYPGRYVVKGEGSRYARIRIEEQESVQTVARGSGNCRSFRSGYKFTLERHVTDSVNAEYALVEVHHDGSVGAYLSGDSVDYDYKNEFVAIPVDVPYRPPRHTPKAMIRGSQTAVVVGKKGEEIWVDKHGRVKVQFHWDRNGKKDDKSSCWVRVATPWAGKSWGFIQIPRMGQEVIVDFLEGDPDRPIITGSVYNGEQTAPYDLPANQTQSGVKSRSSKGGDTKTFNEFRFEDKKGSEEIFVHAEKDLLVEVENDETRTVDHDRTTTIKNDETKEITEGNEAITIKKGNQTLTLDKGDQTVSIKMGDQTLKVGKGSQKVTIFKDQVVTLDTGNQKTHAKLGQISFQAMKSIELKVGPNSIKIDMKGVTINGIQVGITGKAKAELKAPMTDVKGDGMLQVQGGGMANVKSNGLLIMKGSLTMIN